MIIKINSVITTDKTVNLKFNVDSQPYTIDVLDLLHYKESSLINPELKDLYLIQSDINMLTKLAKEFFLNKEFILTPCKHTVGLLIKEI